MTPTHRLCLLVALSLTLVPATTATDIYPPTPDKRLTTDNPRTGDVFGYGLALDENRAAVLAIGETRIYEQQDDTWELTTTLEDSSDGDAINLEDETLTLASPGREELRIYEHTANGWQLDQTLTTPSGQDDLFGASAAFHDNTLAIGAPDYTNDNGTEIGAIYIYTQNTTGHWEHQTTLTPNDEPANTAFGRTVDLHHDTVTVGARNDNPHGWRSGSAYVFEHDQANGWTQTAKLAAPEGSPGDILASSDIAIHEDTIAAPALGYDKPGQDNVGAVHVFTRNDDGTWTHQQRLTGPDSRENDRFGFQVALTATDLVASTSGHAGHAGETGGALYTHARVGDTFAFTGKLLDGTLNSDGFLGHGLGLDNDILLAGSPATDVDGEANAGAVYVFEDLLPEDTIDRAVGDRVDVRPDDSASGKYAAVAGDGDASSDEGVAVSVDGRSEGAAAVSGFGEATGTFVAASMFDDVRCKGICVLVSGTGDAKDHNVLVALSGTGEARCDWAPCLAASGTGYAHGHEAILALGGTGETSCTTDFACLSVTGSGDAFCEARTLSGIACLAVSPLGFSDCRGLESFCFAVGGCNVLGLVDQACPEPAERARSASPITACNEARGSDASSNTSAQTSEIHEEVWDQEVHLDEVTVSVRTSHDAPLVDCNGQDVSRDEWEEP